MNYNQNSWLKLWKGLKRIKMQKLTISRDELICHKKYFYENVVENLKKVRSFQENNGNSYHYVCIIKNN